MRTFPHVCLLLFAAICLCLSACLRQGSSNPEAIEVCHSGSLAVASDEDIANSFYTDVQGQTEGLETLIAETEAKLRQAGYSTTNNPSKAGHILHLNVLHSGKCNAEALRGAVNKGYASPLHLGEGAAAGMVVDALLVQRRVPQAKRPSHVRLENISNRNAVGNSQMRFGLLLPYGMREIPPAFVEVLSSELAAALQPTRALPPRQGDGQGRAK